MTSSSHRLHLASASVSRAHNRSAQTGSANHDRKDGAESHVKACGRAAFSDLQLTGMLSVRA